MTEIASGISVCDIHHYFWLFFTDVVTRVCFGTETWTETQTKIYNKIFFLNRNRNQNLIFSTFLNRKQNLKETFFKPEPEP